MKLRNKKTGEIVTIGHELGDDFDGVGLMLWFDHVEGSELDDHKIYGSLAELNEEWEDYEPVEPIFDEKIRRGIRAWWNMQGNPFKAAAVLCDEKKDLDGFYHWQIFGYIREGKQRESTDLCFRTKKLYAYDSYHDYTKEELCGDEEE